jgi:hypothetical protein
MNKVKLGMKLLVAALLVAAMMVSAQPNKHIQPKKGSQEAVSEIKVAPSSVLQRAPFASYSQGYRMVTDVLDGFGGELESDNYRIPVNSAGQTSAIGISDNDSLVAKAGFVHASFVKRGDANSDGTVGPGDIVHLINYLFRGGAEPCPMEAGDVNCSGAVEPSDIVCLINYLYRDGPPPAC